MPRPNWQQIVLFRPQVVITGDSRAAGPGGAGALCHDYHDNHQHVMHDSHDITTNIDFSENFLSLCLIIQVTTFDNTAYDEMLNLITQHKNFWGLNKWKQAGRLILRCSFERFVKDFNK